MAVKITQLEAENVKRVKAVQLTPAESGLTVIGGRNNQGKTSVLDAIMWTLGGDKMKPGKPFRDGSMVPPRLRVELSNGIIVERSGDKSTLKVTDANGKKAGQTLLNTFVEQFALDMPKFMSSSSKEKAQTLLRVIGLEDKIRQLDQDGQKAYNDRRAVGQIADQKEKYAKELPEYPDAPKEPVSAFELIQRQQAILAQNGENQRKRERVVVLEAERDRLGKELALLEERYKSVCADCETAAKDALDLLDESTEQLEADIQRIDAINEKVRTNQKKRQATDEADELWEEYEGLTQKLEELRNETRRLLEEAKLPLPGLSVDNWELTYNGQPWDCMSGSDQLKVSTAIVRALNPDCGFVLLDKLEQMDLDSLREFGAWMEAEGLQGIATRVSTGGECSIIIEDGKAVGAEPEFDPEPVPGPAVPEWGDEF